MILQKRSFYLDIPETNRDEIQSQIEQLGGKTLVWMDNKAVTDIVTTRRVSGVDYRDPKSGRVVVLSPIDSKLVVSSPIKRSSSSMNTFRMKRLMEKGSEQNLQNEKPQEMLIVAKEYNISVFLYDHFREYLQGQLRLRMSSERNSKKQKAKDEIQSPFTKKIKARCEEKKVETPTKIITTPLSKFKKKIKREISQTPSPSKLMVIQGLKTFQNQYILVEDVSESNLEPFSKEFPKNSNKNSTGFPVINYQKTIYSPFLDVESLNSTVRVGDTELDNTEGYCKICKVSYTAYQEHIFSNLHSSQIEQDSTFKEIDSLLCSISQRLTSKTNSQTTPNTTKSRKMVESS